MIYYSSFFRGTDRSCQFGIHDRFKLVNTVYIISISEFKLKYYFNFNKIQNPII
jgi:hypothetical protein